ncbi:MAG: ATP-grasp domain-containing protein [Solirubrobacteraceae bacterium]|nr:ATP-grasp domain-containing protein [Solirubrobacteraceae bacterium]
MKPGIIGPAHDPQVRRVARRLRELDATGPVVLDLSRFPGSGRASLVDGVPACPGVDVGAVGCWYLRSMPLALPFQPLREVDPHGSATALLDAARRAFAAGRERRSFLASFVAGLARAGATLVNAPAAAAQHFLKLEQLELLRAAGVPLPRTLATNDPEAVADLAASLDGALVYKPLAGGGLCRRVTDDDLRPQRLRALAAAPVLFQEEIPGRNIRVYVVGGRIAASYEIASDELDYRGAETSVRTAEPSDAERAACIAAAAACGMTFTGIDVRRRPDGSFALLECNPSPMFAAIERRTGGAPVTEMLANLLRGAALR